MSHKIDAVLLAKARYEYDKDVEKLRKYSILPDTHNRELFVVGTLALPEDHVTTEITPMMVVEAAERRAEEYGKPIEGYMKELRIAVDRLEAHGPKALVISAYKKYEAYDLAVEAAQSEDPFETILQR